MWPPFGQGACQVTDQPSRLAPVADGPVPRQQLEAALFEIKRGIVGQEGMLERVLGALPGGGHTRFAGRPAPGDGAGRPHGQSYAATRRRCSALFPRTPSTPGPTAKVQSALLEVMQE